MFVNHGPRSGYTVPMETLGHCCIKLGALAPQQGCGVSGSQCSLVLYGVQHCHPHHGHTYPLPPAFMQTEMSLVPGTVRRQAASLPCDPMLCLEASGHKTDPAGQSGPGPQSQESCVTRDAFGRGAAFGGILLVRKAGSTSLSLTLPSDHYSRNYLV